MQCNSLLTDVEKEKITDRLMPNTREFYTEFWKCPGCDRIYWEGSHYLKMKKQLEKLL